MLKTYVTFKKLLYHVLNIDIFLRRTNYQKEILMFFQTRKYYNFTKKIYRALGKFANILSRLALFYVIRFRGP